MAMTLDPSAGNRRGVVRCITSRSGDLRKKGNVDRSELHIITGDSLEQFSIGERLVIRNEQEVVGGMLARGSGTLDFIGLEDPDIWIDPETNLLHLYFTIPLILKNKTFGVHSRISLGHAVGSTLNTLEMTEPVLECDIKRWWTAKEVSIAPRNKVGIRLNLVESSAYERGIHYSVVRTAVADDMGGPWQFGKLVFHPAEHRISWLAEHASPGPLFPRSFVDVGEGRLLGIMNGREASTMLGGSEIIYGIFSVGLFIYDYEHGEIAWVSPEPLIRDSEAKMITFASQFIETTPGEGILYAHVDDSFVRAYTLYAEGIRALLP